MPRMAVNGVSIAYNDYGDGFPIVFAHDYGGGIDTWQPQVSHFARRYRVITYAARGYPPSDVPTDPEAYSLDHSVEDLHALLTGLGITQAFVGGVSMGAGVALVYTMRHPDMVKGAIICSSGTGSTDPAAFTAQQQAGAADLISGGQAGIETRAANMQPLLRTKNPIAWQVIHDQYLTHSPEGLAYTGLGVQGKRPPVFDYEAELSRLETPTLVVIGDDDANCREPGVFLHRVIPNAGLAVFPRTGHLVNLEESDLFNRTLEDFLTRVEAGRW